jgi:ubiquinone/menaquinone biosynthesis C-methylase UbiE
MQLRDPLEIASQLRSPHGINAVEVGEFMAKANKKLYEELSSLIFGLDTGSILEIGPGTGSFISSILSANKNSLYTSIDCSEEMVLTAKEANRSLIEQGKVNIILGDCRKMSFDPGTFDTVITLNTIYFLDPLESYLKEIIRVMKKDAQLILGYRTRAGMMELPFTRYGFSLYETRELEEILLRVGFKSATSKAFQEDVRDPEGRKLRLDSVFTIASLS